MFVKPDGATAHGAPVIQKALHQPARILLSDHAERNNEIDAFECNSHEIAPPFQASLYGEAF